MITFEVAMPGAKGLSVSHPAGRQTLTSFTGKRAGLKLLCPEACKDPFGLGRNRSRDLTTLLATKALVVRFHGRVEALIGPSDQEGPGVIHFGSAARPVLFGCSDADVWPCAGSAEDGVSLRSGPLSLGFQEE